MSGTRAASGTGAVRRGRAVRGTGVGAGREIEVRTGRAVPAVVLRAVLGLLGVLVLVLASTAPGHGLAPAFVTVGALLVPVLVLAPATAAAGGVVVLAGLRLLSGEVPSLPVVLGLVLLVHVLLWCASTTARVTWRGRVEVAVLVDGLRPVAALQVGAQALAVVATLVTGSGGGDVGRVLAILSATVVAWVALSRPVRAFVGSDD